jgi:hypothetical protein
MTSAEHQRKTGGSRPARFCLHAPITPTRRRTLKTYKGFPRGMPTTQAETINTDILAFIKS